MKRVFVSAFVALLVVASAGPASADSDGGRRAYNFPKHDCAGAVPTHVDLYMHTWYRLSTNDHRLDGRITYYSGQCVKSAEYLHIYTIKLWQYYNDKWNPVASSGDKLINVTSGLETWTSPDVDCNQQEPKTHVEVQYRILWKDGTQTALRDDNSYDWYPGSCINPPPSKSSNHEPRLRSKRS
jgi:hypothetical protein